MDRGRRLLLKPDYAGKSAGIVNLPWACGADQAGDEILFTGVFLVLARSRGGNQANPHCHRKFLSSLAQE